MTDAQVTSEAAVQAPPAILIEGAGKDYGRAAGGRREAVSDVGLVVEPGTIHALLGPNGAGKTTTLKMLLGLVRPTAGRFEIFGVRASQPGAKAKLGFLPEAPYFPQQLNVSEVLRLYGRLSGLEDARIAEDSSRLLEIVGLDGTQKTLVSRFSRGMLQRLGLAAALIGSPDVVVLDEPASGLDPVGQRDVRNLMLDLREQGVAVLLSSHQLSEVEAVSDGVTILNRGCVAARGDIDDLLNIAGQTAFKARGQGALPAAVAALASDTAFSGGVAAFSAPDRDVRAVVDALDDAGWTLLSVEPKRDTLEDYFTRLLGDHSAEQPQGGAR